MSIPKRPDVFISYCHKDAKFMEELRVHLKPFVRAGLTTWSDQQLVPGSKWFTQIQTALNAAKVAVMMVSPGFLASNFIHKHELGPLLKKAERGGVRILWVLVRDCAYDKTALKNYQAMISPRKAIAEMKAGRDRAWVKICETIAEAVGPDSDSSTDRAVASDLARTEEHLTKQPSASAPMEPETKHESVSRKKTASLVTARVEQTDAFLVHSVVLPDRPSSIIPRPASSEPERNCSKAGSPRVLVVGTLRKKDPQFKQFRAACRDLGRVLARHQFTIVASTRKEESADVHVLEGANEERANQEPLDVALVCPSVATKDERFPRKERALKKQFANLQIHERVFLQGKLKDVRAQQVEHAHVVILIGGKTGTRHAAETARSAGIPVLPVPAFGGAAEEIWALQKASSLKKELAGTFNAEAIARRAKSLALRRMPVASRKAQRGVEERAII